MKDIKYEFQEAIKEVKKKITKDQLNTIYLCGSILDIENNKDENKYGVTIEFLKLLIKLLEKKEEYELCDTFHKILIRIRDSH